ncbi:hypothetical protein G6F57_007763 [Rhizopus arrhizus]|nr:hypothetical protein G6F65_007580 [Rhizopus arrhizus]KAG1422285.1 hypothetical protein G6F58_003372 [Rhizopus delemar]KAG1344594.1 hypothetical protein G6F63_006102 [Rhizopus arrhizus]KAG1376967.1 hypothetical protein G6F61_007145 [Rhizopus arrhizus]KAG1417127.1 hypothetical protein G6F59_008950 [Rhizopus arrhizus]
MSTMDVLSSIGVNPSGFSKLLCSRFYAQIARPQMEYGIAITYLNHTQLKTLEEAQNKCIHKIYGASRKTSTKVMLHLAIMKERVAILQAQFLFRSLSLPENTLLYHLMPHIQSKKEVGVYDGALVAGVEPPNPALANSSTTCQDVAPSAA